MIAVVELLTVRTTEQLAAQSGRAAEQNLLQDLAMPPGHGSAEALPISRGQLSEQLMNGQVLSSTRAGDGSGHGITDRS